MWPAPWKFRRSHPCSSMRSSCSSCHQVALDREVARCLCEERRCSGHSSAAASSRTALSVLVKALIRSEPLKVFAAGWLSSLHQTMLQGPNILQHDTQHGTCNCTSDSTSLPSISREWARSDQLEQSHLAVADSRAAMFAMVFVMSPIQNAVVAAALAEAVPTAQQQGKLGVIRSAVGKLVLAT